jgi:hypothetical protein
MIRFSKNAFDQLKNRSPKLRQRLLLKVSSNLGGKSIRGTKIGTITEKRVYYALAYKSMCNFVSMVIDGYN